eukprot:Gregarina_sp_Poly_1__5138@NODE_271_length_10278_cov_119_025561_g236_i0_p2_GENE_NODE_271_length_10278_cov_119_025561_g236_i0NODE_271_length_10278_cov_119_025561_g236_i0_p2_ORF_typecomplete_len783_score78_08TssN/PF17555_2/0_15Orf78/PF06024_12/0_96Orf78/PF06024_12/6e03ACR_tran/PF00873_19/4_3_NODE_271_length_10278_cov_119_025561_g236_i0782610174
MAQPTRRVALDTPFSPCFPEVHWPPSKHPNQQWSKSQLFLMLLFAAFAVFVVLNFIYFEFLWIGVIAGIVYVSCVGFLLQHVRMGQDRLTHMAIRRHMIFGVVCLIELMVLFVMEMSLLTPLVANFFGLTGERRVPIFLTPLVVQRVPEYRQAFSLGNYRLLAPEEGERHQTATSYSAGFVASVIRFTTPFMALETLLTLTAIIGMIVMLKRLMKLGQQYKCIHDFSVTGNLSVISNPTEHRIEISDGSPPRAVGGSDDIGEANDPRELHQYEQQSDNQQGENAPTPASPMPVPIVPLSPHFSPIRVTSPHPHQHVGPQSPSPRFGTPPASTSRGSLEKKGPFIYICSPAATDAVRPSPHSPGNVFSPPASCQLDCHSPHWEPKPIKEFVSAGSARSGATSPKLYTPYEERYHTGPSVLRSPQSSPSEMTPQRPCSPWNLDKHSDVDPGSPRTHSSCQNEHIAHPFDSYDQAVALREEYSDRSPFSHPPNLGYPTPGGIPDKAIESALPTFGCHHDNADGDLMIGSEITSNPVSRSSISCPTTERQSPYSQVSLAEQGQQENSAEPSPLDSIQAPFQEDLSTAQLLSPSIIPQRSPGGTSDPRLPLAARRQACKPQQDWQGHRFKLKGYKVVARGKPETVVKSEEASDAGLPTPPIYPAQTSTQQSVVDSGSALPSVSDSRVGTEGFSASHKWGSRPPDELEELSANPAELSHSLSHAKEAISSSMESFPTLRHSAKSSSLGRLGTFFRRYSSDEVRHDIEKESDFIPDEVKEGRSSTSSAQ